MPLQLPVLDDRDFEELLEEARRRIPAYTPEWTNFGGESDPGITIVELFAFLTESLLYRANRIPERNRLKFLQTLGVPLQPAAPADGIITIRNERGPLAALPLNRGVIVSAGDVDFLTRDPVNVLPVEAQVYYKRMIAENDPSYAEYQGRYQAVLEAELAASGEASGVETDDGTAATPAVKLAFYEPTQLPVARPGEPNPVLDLKNEAMGRALYIALLAPPNVDPQVVRPLLGDQTLSIGIVPALQGDVPPILPERSAVSRPPSLALAYEIARVVEGAQDAQYVPLRQVASPDVLNQIGVVQLQLPSAGEIRAWQFTDPLQEGSGEFPPRLEDESLNARLITWLRIRLPSPGQATTENPADAKISWVGINATRIYQAVGVVNELLGTGNGEPDQSFMLANLPVLPASIAIVIQKLETGEVEQWRLTDDLLAAGVDERVFTLDPESGLITFGDGLHGARPQLRWRILASYEYGGGVRGNVGIGAVKASRDTRLQGGFTISNPFPTSGGDLGESVTEAERSIPLYLRHRERLVTREDFRDVAARTPGVDVGRVEVLSLFRPGNVPETDVPGVVTVMVIPRFDPVRPLWPVPDRLFLQRVCDHLRPRRLVTTEIYVRGPVYLPVYISVGIRVRAGYFEDEVRATVRSVLNLYLSSNRPGGPEQLGWPLNKRLMRKDLEAVVTRVPGVEFVESLELGVTSPADIAEYDMTGLQLPVVVGLNVVSGVAEPLAEVFGTQMTPTDPGTRVVPIPVSKAKC
jgi:hypothetical protein